MTQINPAVLDVIRTAAPAVAGVLAGVVNPALAVPAGALAKAAVDTVAERMGAPKPRSTSPKDMRPTIERIESKVLKGIEAGPSSPELRDVALALKGADPEMFSRFAEYELERERIMQAAVSDARRTFGDSLFQRLFGGFVMGIACGTFFLVMSPWVNWDNREMAFMAGVIVGWVANWATAVVQYYFGSSRGSADKSNIIESTMTRR